ncbi:hypothetical protein BaRGS_00020548, partial [Batillaria attramentaria]
MTRINKHCGDVPSLDWQECGSELSTLYLHYLIESGHYTLSVTHRSTIYIFQYPDRRGGGMFHCDGAGGYEYTHICMYIR